MTLSTTRCARRLPSASSPSRATTPRRGVARSRKHPLRRLAPFRRKRSIPLVISFIRRPLPLPLPARSFGDVGALTSRRGGKTRRAAAAAVVVASKAKEVHLLDYGAGNVRSVRNAITKLGFTVIDIAKPEEIARADRLIFPGVGAYGSAMDVLKARGLVDPLRDYVASGKPFMGVCLGLQLLFDGSEESGGVEGLGVIPGTVGRFTGDDLIVPHIGWNTLDVRKDTGLLSDVPDGDRLYFVHSYRAVPEKANEDWVLATCDYGGEFIAAVQKGEVTACQFHPEKSGEKGIGIFKNFLEGNANAREAAGDGARSRSKSDRVATDRGLAKRVIACLDVRSNDNGDLVVTKGDSYDVRESSSDGGDVRNLGKPVELAGKYFEQGADEVAFLNITGYRDLPLTDAPMLEVLRRSSETVFVPLTVGGGIRDFTDSNGVSYTSLEVASAYFSSGADKARPCLQWSPSIRPRRRGERRSLRTLSPGDSLRPPLDFNPDTLRRLSTPLLTPFNSTPTFVASCGPSTPRYPSAQTRCTSRRRTTRPGVKKTARRAWSRSASGTGTRRW